MKNCAMCGEAMQKRPKEAYWQWEKRRCCSLRCAARLRQPHRADIKSRYRNIKVNGRKIAEHRYVMEQAIGRELRTDEHVHHKNGDRLDNRLENLTIVDPVEHAKHHAPQIHPTVKACVICGDEFTPHPTKRARQQTCSPPCKSRLLSIRHAKRK